MDYTDMSGGISAENRRLLQLLHRAGRGPFTVRDAAAVWQTGPSRASRLLRTLKTGGWLARPRRGLYVPVPLDAARSGEWHEDPWLVAAKLFPTGYIGGWSACEHWALTDQLFRDVLVFSPRRIDDRTVRLKEGSIQVRHVAKAKLFGLRPVWRSNVRVPVSDPTRTIVDVLDDPSNGGGIRHVAEVVEAYFRSEHRDDELLIQYTEQLGNRAVFKRLGFITEALTIEAPKIYVTSRARLSRGISLLDPALPTRGPILTKWNLRLNADLRS